MIRWKKATKEERKLFEALSIIFRNDPLLLMCLVEPNRPRLSDSIEELLQFSENSFSAQQDLLFRVGMDLWSGGGDACVWELIEYLDDERLGNVLKALRFLGTKFNGWDGPCCRQLKFPSDNLRRQLKLDTGSDF